MTSVKNLLNVNLNSGQRATVSPTLNRGSQLHLVTHA